MLTAAQILALIASLVHVAEMMMESLPPDERTRVGQKVLARLDWIDGIAEKLRIDVKTAVEKAKAAVTT